MKYLYIFKTGTTFSTTKQNYNDFEHWVRAVLKTKKQYIKIIDVKKQKLPNLQSAKGIIITGSHDMVSDSAPWMKDLKRYIKKAVHKKIFVLGICFGHQLINEALGGKSGYNKKGKEIGTAKISRLKSSLNDPLFKGFSKEFYGYETHFQSALKLPARAKVLAKNAHDKHQGVRYSQTIWGIQFHPEFSKAIMKEYIYNQKDFIAFHHRVIQKIKPAHMSAKILNNFEMLAERGVR